VYTAAKHQVPTAVGVKVPEVAPEVIPAPGFNVAAGGTAVPDGHSAGPANGPHTLKATVPVGASPVALPLTVTESVAVPVGPTTTEAGDAAVALDEDAAVTVKHSAPVCWATAL
jgi:hypothetical protein